MALVEMPITYSVTLKDRGGNTSTLQFKSNGSAPLTAGTLMVSLKDTLQAITQAKVIKCSYRYGYEEDDLSVSASNGEVEEKAVITVALATTTPPQPGQTRYANIQIPAPVPGLFQAAFGELYNVVDPTDAGLQAFLANFEYGAGVLPALTLSDGQTIEDPTVAGNVKGKRIHAGSRKG